MFSPQLVVSKKMPVAIVKGLSKHIHGDLVRDVVEYANIPQLQHECVVRSHFSDELSFYEKEVAGARIVLKNFVDTEWLPDIKGLLRRFDVRKGTRNSSFHVKEFASINDAFDIILRYSNYRNEEVDLPSERMAILRDTLFHWYSIQAFPREFATVNSFSGSREYHLLYTIDVPARIVDNHIKQLVQCGTAC
eukprot:TRINITY_DN3856_c1_g1_i1.p2 TRINITY_DN3856_c1_g1~~TRINITY_DN3856_c1_g1_i1.p2  ORF type:complete len:192 (+),score=27.56 TRINITY_DN3856_c1_g1_i1:94-669(+)